ncbi:MAG: glycosyltransferase family 4 protein [Ignavibacteria bacterium]|nr:glycosyltransferase family 4 protein [Ignavibacteria bacterium]
MRRETIPVQILDKRKFTPRLFRTALDRISFDPKTTIIHGHGFLSVSSEMIYSKFLGAKGVVVHVQNIVPQLTLKQILKKTILDRVTNQFIAVSDDVASSLRRVKVSNITTIKNSADSSGWTFMARPKNQHLGFPSNAFVLGMVGRVVKYKGFDLFLDIITGIKDVYGVIVGDGEYYPEVKRIIDRRNLSSKIKCFDFQAKLQDYYQLLDALFLYSLHEGGPLVLLESQAVGVPYLGNEVGYVGEVVENGHNGYLIDNTNLSEINQRIQDIKTNRDRLRKNCRPIIEKGFSLRQQMKAIEHLYNSILGLPRGRYSSSCYR